MNITFLIGNGFDIGLGMETSFRQFFPIYRAKSANKDSCIKELSERIAEDEDTWSYFERQLGEYTANFDKDTIKNFNAQINDFTSEFIKYLEGQENRVSYENNQLISKTITDGLINFYKQNNLPAESERLIDNVFKNRENEEHKYNFVSFNYTDTLKNCVKTIKENVVNVRDYRSTKITDKIGSIVNVHGTKNVFPIMGVNDKTQIANKQLADIPSFEDRIVKPRMNKRIKMQNAEQAMNIINQSHIICIYGMSLGVTDRDWWNYIIRWLNGNDSRQLIIFNYDDKYSQSLPTNWMDKEDTIMELLAQYNKNPSISVEKLRNRIHIAVHKNIFSMNLTRKSDTIFDEALSKLQVG